MLTLVRRLGSAKYWRLAYCFNSEQKTLALGVYPEVRLAAASKKAPSRPHPTG
ncbi:MAG: DUF4102 domain-containing protein [Gammaproteobacteria bacterium]|nr:DUF4102 domain-containing protein [Gammaproteobacteria bacterium]MBK9427836.1 DUF4102 domain-containing protein [Gammaproteobacteria bacterium]